MTINSEDVSVGTSATKIVDANSGRRKLILKNAGSTDVFIGDASVTTGDGFPIKPNEEVDVSNYQGDWYGIVASGSETVQYLEEVS